MQLVVLIVFQGLCVMVTGLQPLVFFDNSGDELKIVPKTIAFGSCCDQKSSVDTTLWQSVAKKDPDLWVWMGDNIYPNEDLRVDAAAEEADKKFNYGLQAAKPGYAHLQETTAIVGTWDDHDYCCNDGGFEYAHKEMSKRVMLDFLKEPQDSPRRTRQEGVYAAYTLGDEQHRVKVILLDCRTFLDHSSEDGDVLGRAQWEWLTSEMTTGNQKLNIIVSSIQVVNDGSILSENWKDWPRELKRLYSLIDREDVAQSVVFSGDRHMGEIARDCGVQHRYGGLVEVTTSGVTKHRPAAWTVFDCNEYRISGVMPDINFGTIDFDWNSMKLYLSVRNEHGVAVQSATVNMALKGSNSTCITGTAAPKMCGLVSLVGIIIMCIACSLLLPFALVISFRASKLFAGRIINGSNSPYRNNNNNSNNSNNNDDSFPIWKGIGQFKSWVSGSGNKRGRYRRLCEPATDDENAML